MSRVIYSSLSALIVSAVLLPFAFGFQAASLPTPAATSAASSQRTIKDKIVFVRADPTIGGSAMRTITGAESGPGGIGDQANDVTGAANAGGMVPTTHDAPDMQGRAAANPRTSEI